MKELEEELSEINIPCKPHEDVVDEFHADGILNHRGQDQDNSTTSGSSASPPRIIQSSSSTINSEADKSSENERFLSFNQSPGSAQSVSSAPEQQFNQHFNIDELEEKDLNQGLQDTTMENKPVSASAGELVLEPEPEKEPTSADLAEEDTPSRRRSSRISMPTDRYNSPAFKMPAPRSKKVTKSIALYP